MPTSSAIAPRRSAVSTARALRRWACSWLALLTLVQMLAATLAGVHGIGHRHRTSAQAAGTPSTPLIRWRHGEPVHAWPPTRTRNCMRTATRTTTPRPMPACCR